MSQGYTSTAVRILPAHDAAFPLAKVAPRSTIVIPARMASTRLPRKLLLRETGKSVIRHTVEAARHAQLPIDVVVATDHEEIAREVESFGCRAVMTSVDCASGTDRVAEVARALTNVDIVVNVQGDEPEILGDSIDLAVRLLERDPAAVMSTLSTPIHSKEQLFDPACVKVTSDRAGRAMYFSRSVIPHPREWSDDLLCAVPHLFHQHIGLYAYRRDFLLRIADLPPSRFEQVEKLEQLRVLEAGHTIVVGTVALHTRGIDTPADYRAFVERMRAR